MISEKFCVIIPSRYDSSRFPGKPLIDIDGMSMIERVYKRCLLSSADKVIVATSDKNIYDHVSTFGECMITPIFETGTQRVCYAAKNLKEKFDYIINVQGDQPYVDVNFLNRFIGDVPWLKGKSIQTGGIKMNHSDPRLKDRNTVKLIKDGPYRAIGFTRSPFYGLNPSIYQHIGIYGFRFENIDEISLIDHTENSLAESLEQISWMDHGFKISFTTSYSDSISIDTLDDYKRCLSKIASGALK